MKKNAFLLFEVAVVLGLLALSVFVLGRFYRLSESLVFDCFERQKLLLLADDVFEYGETSVKVPFFVRRVVLGEEGGAFESDLYHELVAVLGRESVVLPEFNCSVIVAQSSQKGFVRKIVLVGR